jgi:hypothetical protein
VHATSGNGLETGTVAAILASINLCLNKEIALGLVVFVKVVWSHTKLAEVTRTASEQLCCWTMVFGSGCKFVDSGFSRYDLLRCGGLAVGLGRLLALYSL